MCVLVIRFHKYWVPIRKLWIFLDFFLFVRIFACVFLLLQHFFLIKVIRTHTRNNIIHGLQHSLFRIILITSVTVLSVVALTVVLVYCLNWMPWGIFVVKKTILLSITFAKKKEPFSLLCIIFSIHRRRRKKRRERNASNSKLKCANPIETGAILKINIYKLIHER